VIVCQTLLNHETETHESRLRISSRNKRKAEARLNPRFKSLAKQ